MDTDLEALINALRTRTLTLMKANTILWMALMIFVCSCTKKGKLPTSAEIKSKAEANLYLVQDLARAEAEQVQLEDRLSNEESVGNAQLLAIKLNDAKQKASEISKAHENLNIEIREMVGKYPVGQMPQSYEHEIHAYYRELQRARVDFNTNREEKDREVINKLSSMNLDEVFEKYHCADPEAELERLGKELMQNADDVERRSGDAGLDQAKSDEQR